MTDIVSPDTRFGTYFRAGEFTRSETAERLGITVEIPTGSDVETNLRALVTGVFDPLRADLDAVVVVTSGWRPDELNKAVGGAPDSQHTTGEAGDVRSPDYSPYDIARRVVQLSLPFDQLILEHDQHVVHASHVRGRNRREALTRYVNNDGDLVYVAGLVPEEHLS